MCFPFVCSLAHWILNWLESVNNNNIHWQMYTNTIISYVASVLKAQLNCASCNLPDCNFWCVVLGRRTVMTIWWQIRLDMVTHTHSRTRTQTQHTHTYKQMRTVDLDVSSWSSLHTRWWSTTHRHLYVIYTSQKEHQFAVIICRVSSYPLISIFHVDNVFLPRCLSQ